MRGGGGGAGDAARQMGLPSALAEVRWRNWRQRGQHVREIPLKIPHSSWAFAMITAPQSKWLSPAPRECVAWAGLCSRLRADWPASLLFWASGLRCIPHPHLAACGRHSSSSGGRGTPRSLTPYWRDGCHACLYSTGHGKSQGPARRNVLEGRRQ